MAEGLVLVASTIDHDRHDTGSGHPERRSRLTAIASGIDDARLAGHVRPLAVERAPADDLARVHRRDYLRELEELSATGGGLVHPDTPMSRWSWDTALWSAGAGLAAIEALDNGEGDAAFVAVRPPGHHATAGRAMGFCLLNNVAVAAAALADRGERVLIFDWDVHHGNGTQDIFWNDPRVLYVSLHEWPAYPGTGRPSDDGGPEARGLTVNVPLPPGATGDVALAAYDEVAAPAIDAFAPTWVLVSAGFDAHRDDPLGQLAWSAGDYADLTERLISSAPAPGRVIALLEGGYDFEALRNSSAATIAALAGQRYRPERSTHGGPGREHVADVKRIRRSRG